MTEGLTPKQQSILKAIETHVHEHGRPPSYKELQIQFGYGSSASVWRFVQALKAKGLLAAESRQWNSLRPKEQETTHPQEIPSNLMEIEIIGKIYREKTPVLSIQSTPLLLPSALLNNTPGCYGLRIVDASYIDLHLLPNDLIIVDPRTNIQPGELVLASNQQTIIGHFFEEGELIQFRSSPYAQYGLQERTIRVPIDDTHIWGIIIASIRAPQLFTE